MNARTLSKQSRRIEYSWIKVTFRVLSLNDYFPKYYFLFSLKPTAQSYFVHKLFDAQTTNKPDHFLNNIY